MKRKLYIILAILPLLCGFNSYGQGKITRPVKQQSHNIKPQKKAPEVTVSEPDGFLNGYGYVDLGLPSGTKWAINNIGAKLPYEYGNYYAWGETNIKSVYDDKNSKTYGVKFDDIGGNIQYDAATANWGDNWRIPSKDQCLELINKCTWSWSSFGGRNGYKVVGPNNKIIFIPAAGERFGNKLNDCGSFGGYWSSTPDETEPRHAYHFFFNKHNVSNVIWWNRTSGVTIRPVSK